LQEAGYKNEPIVFKYSTGNAYVNDLNLTVTVGGVAYKGNVFSGASSTTGGSADFRNNVESVFVPAGVTGTVVVRVTAANLAADAVPGSGGATDQDFALVVYNANVAPPGADIQLTAASIVAESIAPANGVATCPAHKSTFSIVDGHHISGPATEGLSPVAITVDGNEVRKG